MIYKFALALIFALAFGSDLIDQNEQYYDAVSDQNEQYYDTVSEPKQEGSKINDAAYEDQKQGEKIELEKHPETQKLSESQKPKSFPASGLIRSKDLQRDISRSFTPRTLMKAKMLDKTWIGVREIYNKLTPRAGLFESKETKEIFFETRESSLNEIQLAQNIKFEDRTNDSQNLIQERNWNEMFSKQIITSTRHGRDFQKALVELVDVGTREAVSGRTPLYLAVIWERIDLVELFLERGADVDAVDSKNQTPLLRAVLCGKKFGIIEFLLTHGANPNFKGYEGKTVLNHLVERNDIPLIELFLKHDAHICLNYNDTYVSAATVEFFLTRGAADPNSKDDRGRTMLHRAARTNNVALIEILLNNGANIDATTTFRMTPLMYAAQSGSCKAVELLLRRGADPNIVDTFGGNKAYDLCTKYHTCKCAYNLKNAENNPSQFINDFC